jgi:hypothetical protein
MLFCPEWSHGHSGSGVHTALFSSPGGTKLSANRRGSACLDGDEYFSAFRAVAIRAQQSIMILGWDFDSRTGRVIDQKLEWLITDSRS